MEHMLREKDYFLKIIKNAQYHVALVTIKYWFLKFHLSSIILVNL